MILDDEIGIRIRNIRKSLQLSQRELSTKLDVSDSSLSEIETGRSKPGFDFIYKLGKLFNVNLYYLIYGEGDIFIDPLVSLSTRISRFAVNEADVRDFLYYFERSPSVQYAILSKYRELMIRDIDIISKEVERYEKGGKGNSKKS